MAKVKCARLTVRCIDTRTVRPPPQKADDELLTAAHRAWAKAVKERAGWRCEAVDKGQRCQVSAPSRLFADHIIERRDGGDLTDLANGQCLCGKHHTAKTAAARAKRMADRPHQQG